MFWLRKGTIVNANDILKYGHLTVLQAVDGLPPADWETPGVCGVWSVKDIVAHLASYERTHAGGRAGEPADG
ncbi:MAG: maleylpyruvate isomerase N-terminal domain-containing protein [Aggregatilineales bacterium]